MRKLVNNGNTTSYFGYSDQTLYHQPVDFKSITNNYSFAYAYQNGAISYTNLFSNSYTDDRFISGYSNLGICL